MELRGEADDLTARFVLKMATAMFAEALDNFQH
jgi:hypothetical protein